MEKTIERKKIPLGVKIGYGGAEGANSLIWTLFAIYFLYFLTDIAKIEPAIAGFIMMIGILWDAVTDPLIGVWSDGLKTRWGRRRPIIIAIAVPYGVASWLLFSDFGLGPDGKVVYFVFAVIFYMTMFTLLNVPHTALAAEMTQDYNERTSLVSYRTLWSMVFSILGGAMPLVLAEAFAEMTGNQQTGWSIMAGVLGVISVPPIILMWRTTRGYELLPTNTEVSYKDLMGTFKNNRPFRYILGIWTFAIVAINIAGAAAIYFLTYRMGFTENDTSLAMLLYFIASILWIPVINKTANRLGKRKAFIIFMGLAACCSAVLTLLIGPEDVTLLYIALVLSAVGNSTTYLLGWSMIPDVVEVDEFKTGQRREGLFFGIIAFVQKCSSAIAVWLVGVTLSVVGYVPDAIQTEQAMWGIRLTYAEGTALFILLSMLVCWFSPITPEKHKALNQAIQNKKNGLDCDLTLIQDILR